MSSFVNCERKNIQIGMKINGKRGKRGKREKQMLRLQTNSKHFRFYSQRRDGFALTVLQSGILLFVRKQRFNIRYIACTRI